MALLAEYSVPARPDRRVMEVHDADAYLGDDAAMDAARTEVVAGNGYHLYLLSLQPDIRVQVTIRIWDSPPPGPPADAEGHTAVGLESETGILVVNQLTFGPAGEMTLPRPGVYEGHAWWTGRRAMAAFYDSTLERLADDPDALEAWKDAPVTERYVLDLAWEREPEPVDEDDDVVEF
ncbi:hypothetical protein AB0B04_31785 [Streptomyces xinghaiensis]|uniref:Uncharacterized protein n=3 Tax=Streptomyces TaxID=1883 RepID=A0A3M8ERA7_9ACTN|nr:MULTISPECIES: hypothetical protein [Streptomyces]KNE79299.1 hypothetical protein ADZ36_28370 [Streptomyces fradiae]OFA34007.1 hypothetical protein BEN35_31655 [Streptomyces fradiae]PQM19705.1 hypothetical protein Sfr7A_30625 [Streptomyces xinghaiensis]RKM90693.1 hypothetical protein SFRA_031475 [Streptomyces xinghaiensis]RNC68549.1 hypothetical protein DC095_031905 [Streptomyces xinghaiensis]